MQPATEDHLGTALCNGRYRVSKPLEESPLGSSYVGAGEGDAPVVVRFVAEALWSQPGFADVLAQCVERLRSPANPRLARVLDAGEVDGRPFVVTEACSGTNLAERLDRSGAIPADVLGTWLEPLARTLDELHAAGLVHRDLRPANVYPIPGAGVRLADCVLPDLAHGLVAESSAALDLASLGVAEYTPPELIVDGRSGTAGDQYSLGILVHELLSGRPPFQSGSPSATLAAHLETPPPPLGVSVSRSIRTAVVTALAKEPEDRFPTCSDFAAAFVNALGVDVGSIVGLAPSASGLADAPPNTSIDSSTLISMQGSSVVEPFPEEGQWAEDQWDDDPVEPEPPVVEDAWDDPEPEPEPEPERTTAPEPTKSIKPGSGSTPLWKRPFVIVSAVVGGPLLCTVLYYGYVLFLKPAPEFGATFGKNGVRSSLPPSVDDSPRPAVPGGPASVAPGERRSATGSLPATQSAELRKWLDEMLVTATVDTNDPPTALAAIVPAKAEGDENRPTIAIDRAAFSLLAMGGRRVEREFADTPLAEALGTVAEDLPQLCVAVDGESGLRLTTWSMASRLGLGTLDIGKPPGTPVDDPFVVDVSVETADRTYAEVLEFVAEEAGLEVRFDDDVRGPLAAAVPRDFRAPSTDARTLLVTLLAKHDGIVLARDPGFPAWRATRLVAAEAAGLEVLGSEKVTTEDRLWRPVGPVDDLDQADVPLASLFSKTLETVGIQGSVETEPLERAGLADSLRDSLRQNLLAFGPADGRSGDVSTVVEILGRTLTENAGAVLLVDPAGNRATLTTREAAKGTGREVIPVGDAVRQVEIARSAAAIEPVENSLGMTFVRIEPGRFGMGASASDPDAEADERPLHSVEITRPYLLGRFEVTQEEFAAVTGRNPSRFSNTGTNAEAARHVDTSRLPVENVTWFDAALFANALGEREELPPYYEITQAEIDKNGATIGAEVTVLGGLGYRLPTEAEWEFACRWASETPWFFGTGYAAGRYAWHAGNATNRPQPAGSLHPNGRGLFHQHGNVREWTDDWYRDDFYPGPTDTDPAGPRWGTMRSVRGGSYAEPLTAGRSTAREGIAPAMASPTIGFRLARAPEPVDEESEPKQP